MLPMMLLLISIQDAGTPITTAVTDPVDVQKFLGTVVTAVQSGNWQAAAALALIFCIYLLRRSATKIPGPVGAWLNTDRGGSTLVVLAGVAAAAATAALAGHKITVSLLLTGLTTGAMASGARNVVWDILFPADKAVAPDAPPAQPDPPKAA
jgi:hypothetical protein